MAVELSPKQFHSRATTLLKAFASDSDGSFAGADCLVVVSGLSDESEAGYQKTSALQLWLLGYEFTDTILVFLKDKIAVLTSIKKANILQTLEDAMGIEEKVPIVLYRRGKDEAANKALFEEFANVVKAAGSKAGVIVKDKQKGKFVDEWKAVIGTKGIEEVDVAAGIATGMAVKDFEDLKNMELACKLTTTVLQNFFVDEFQAIVDNGKKVTHEALSLQTEDVLLNPKKRTKMRFPKEAQLDSAEWCYTPIIQSGGKYDLKPSAQSDKTALHDGTILCSMGVRYKNYCSNISRTFFINPEKTKEKNYIFLHDLQSHVLSLLKDGALCKDVYSQAVQYVESKRPDLVPNFVKNAGFAIGIEFKDSTYAISSKSSKVLTDGMTINLSLGFQNIENTESNGKDPRNKVYSLLLADTVRVTKAEPVYLTNYDRDFKDISWEMNDEDDEPAVDNKKSAAKIPTAVLKTKLRNDEDEMTNEQRRTLHQKELADARHAEGLARYSEGGAAKALEKAAFRKFECYRKETLLPKAVEQLRIVVDRRSEAIVLPVYGMAVPFHITTLKTIVKNEEGASTYLRFNFQIPGQSTGKKEAVTPFEDASATFVKAMTFKSSDTARFAEIFREVNELKKDVSKREAERKEKADLVEQDKLIEMRGAGRRLLLREVYARPALEGKRFAGDLELHTNGLRYQSALRNDQRIDVLFSNIKHLIFQPCEGELIVIIHIHLKNEIMIGRKKTKDVQFYREVTDANFDETGNRKRRQNYGDEDEFAAEQEERQRRAALDKEFKQFAEKIADASNGEVEVDVPFRDLGFQGVPFRQPVLLAPTTDCLVHLVEPPFVVTTISEIERVHLERVRFGLKSFDLVVVYKDFTRPVQHINTIPTDQLENLKEWLDSVDVPFTEGPINLSWPQIMKTVNESPFDFYNEGGWSFLQADSEEDDEDEQESEYAGSDSDSGGGDSDESDSEDYDSDDDASGSGSGSDDDSDEEEGEDWDELERKAAKHDRRKDDREDLSPPQKSKKRRDDSDDDRPRKKKSSGGGR
ncbi:FACT complex subunit-domain-containing protein [Obelidium mucronatum]|nr:FACT complex subunit-domain-containing protein [Obelidium mucronatum]